MNRIIAFCTPALALVGMATVAVASVPDLTLSEAWIADEAIGAGLTVAPDGSWAPFNEAYDPEGNLVDATITLRLLDDQGLAIQNYPAADIWLETTGSSFNSCVGGSSPDQDTNLAGETYWLEPLHAGGCSVGETTVVFVGGAPLLSDDIELVFRSFDFNGDLNVNLSDIVIFTQSIGLDSPCADYNNDGVIGLTDIVRLTQGLGGNCD